jgi:hypothetical protein
MNQWQPLRIFFPTAIAPQANAKMATGNAKWEFKNQYINIDAKSGSTAPYEVDRHPSAVQCVRCKELEYVRECPNCGGHRYDAGYDSHGVVGLFCAGCKKGRTRWTCQKCGTDNSMAKTFGQLYPKSFCFIATATYESPEAPEVVFLREFRDRVLLKSLAGQRFVDAYYRLSPPVAKLISHSRMLKHSSRMLLSHLVRYLERQRRS